MILNAVITQVISNGSMDFADPEEFNNPKIRNYCQTEVDFDNPKGYVDTTIFEVHVSFKKGSTGCHFRFADILYCSNGRMHDP